MTAEIHQFLQKSNQKADCAFWKGPGHTSTCATSNGPALPVGPCDCGAGIEPVVGTENKEPV